MKGTAKVAVSLPIATLRSLERARLRLRRTRSAAVTEAIERWLSSSEIGEADKRYVEGYLRRPERASESAAVAEAATREWDDWE
jgi:hypothetical protein